ncbi:MAG: fibronectin type III domain-containing protein, partial [Planctomycetes bacterium]|nr:fibronectin type III domain-containing protein [Planctomycetota bacterium]
GSPRSPWLVLFVALPLALACRREARAVVIALLTAVALDACGADAPGPSDASPADASADASTDADVGTDGGVATSLRLTDLAPGTEYHWTVVAVDGAGRRTASDVWTFTTLP